MAKTTVSARAPAAPSIFMTAAEVAVTLRIARRTLDSLVASGALPQPIRLTRKTVRWTRAEIEALATRS